MYTNTIANFPQLGQRNLQGCPQDSKNRQTSLTKAHLSKDHYQHFSDDGWLPDEIDWALSLDYGPSSASYPESAKRLGYNPPSAGIWFQFSETWGQLRPDRRAYEDGSESPKYCSPKGEVDSKALWLPPETKLSDLDAVTEGWKDAAMGTLRGGCAVGAIGGVSHVAKVLPKGCGVTLVFDSDAWLNAGVMGALISGGLHTGGKVAIIPERYGAKAGCTEFFNGGGDRAEFQQLLADAFTPRELLEEWMRRLVADPLAKIKNCDDIQAIYRKVRKLAKSVGLSWKVVQEWQRNHVAAWRVAYEADLRKHQVLSLHDAPVGQFEPLQLPMNGERKLFVLNGQKGTGKTSIALKSLIEASKALGLSVIYFCPTRVLTRDVANKLGLDSHLDPVLASQSRYLAACAESAHTFRDRHWDVVVIDECNEVIPRNWKGSLGQNPRAARSALQAQIASAQVVAIAQDGLYRPVLNAVQRIGRFSADQVEVISRRRPQSAATVTLHEGSDGYQSWAEALLRSAGDGTRLAIPSGSEAETSVLQRWLRQRHPEGNHRRLVGSSKSFSVDRKAFAAGPDLWIQENQPDTLAFSPVFNSGVSLEQQYFEAQFEYVAGMETSSSASQRGERVRDAIGGIPRHVFIQTRGMPRLPSLEVFSPEYWRELLQIEDRQQRPNLRTLGMEDVEKMLDRELCAIDEFPELGEVLAIEAREIHLKREALRAEWEANGWAVVTAPALDPEIAKAISSERRDIQEEILASKARSLALAPSLGEAEKRSPKALGLFHAGAEPEGPVRALKFQRWGVEDKLGDLALMNSSEFWGAFHLGGHGEIGAAQLNALMRIQYDQPELWEQITRNAALRLVGNQATRDAAAVQTASGCFYDRQQLPPVPDLASSLRLIRTAALLGRCPGLREAVVGELHEWNKNTDEVRRAHRWAIAHAAELAALSKCNQRCFGLQFTEQTPPVKAFHKLLKMVGIDSCLERQRDGVRHYRRRTITDVQIKLKRAQADGRHTAKVVRELYQQQHRREVVDAAYAQAVNRHNDAAQQWLELEAFTRKHLGQETQLQEERSTTTEVVLSPQQPRPITRGDWEEMREMLALAKLLAGVADLRRTLLPDLGQDLWALLVRDADYPSALLGGT